MRSTPSLIQGLVLHSRPSAPRPAAPGMGRHGRRRMPCPGWLFAACFATPWVAPPVHAQVIQLKSHKAVFGDASAAIAMSDSIMFVCNNENEVLGLYARYPDTACTVPIYTFNARPFLAPAGNDSAADLESVVRIGSSLYWLGSLGNNKNGALRPNRDRLFATQIHGYGTGNPPWTLSYVGRYDYLRED